MSKNLKGKRAFIAGVADDRGFGWAIAKELADQGCEILFGVWPPALNIFKLSWDQNKLDRALPSGGDLEVAKIYPLDAVYDTKESVPQEVAENKRYQGLGGYTISEVAALIEKDFGKIDILVHSLANGPEVKKPLLETSRSGYLAAMSASSYSLVSMAAFFGPIMHSGGSILSLTYLAAERVIPGYGGGMSSAKAALESDTKVLAFEAGRKWGIRVNAISAGALASRAATAIGFIGDMIKYAKANAPLTRDLEAEDVGAAASFLLSDAARAITGVTLYVDNGIHAMGVSLDSPEFEKKEQ